MFSDGTALSFWDQWGLLGGLIICLLCTFLPRIAMLFTVVFGNLGVGCLGVVGWVFIPRVTIAIIATANYFDTNPILCIFAWLLLLSGEGVEKAAITSKVR